MNQNDTSTETLPLFAQLLEQSETQIAGGNAPTYHCLDSNCTKKYPSDDDDCYNNVW